MKHLKRVIALGLVCLATSACRREQVESLGNTGLDMIWRDAARRQNLEDRARTAVQQALRDRLVGWRVIARWWFFGWHETTLVSIVGVDANLSVGTMAPDLTIDSMGYSCTETATHFFVRAPYRLTLPPGNGAFVSAFVRTGEWYVPNVTVIADNLSGSLSGTVDLAINRGSLNLETSSATISGVSLSYSIGIPTLFGRIDVTSLLRSTVDGALSDNLVGTVINNFVSLF